MRLFPLLYSLYNVLSVIPIAFALFAFLVFVLLFPFVRLLHSPCSVACVYVECMYVRQWCRFDDVHSSFGMIRDARIIVRECGLHDM